MSNTKIAVRNIRRHKSRSLLTLLGIAIGIGLVISLGSITEGLRLQLEEQFEDMAAVVNVNSIDDDDGISEDVIEGIGDIPGVESVIPTSKYKITRSISGSEMSGMSGRKMGEAGMIIKQAGGSMGGKASSSMTFTGIHPEDLDVLVGDELGAMEGRRLDESDNGEEVVLLGYSTSSKQNLNVGDEIEYEREIEDGDNVETESYFFEVVGILEETGDSSIDGSTYVPLATMQGIEEDETITSLIVNIDSIDSVEDISDKINNEFEDEVSAVSFVAMIRQIESTMSGMQLALIAIGAVAALVGGIGIMNTMIMSVMERRRDMGIMKAIGATRTAILSQVLQEALILSFMGGVAGIVMADIGKGAMSSLTGFSGVITLNLVLLGMGFAITLGISAGIYPALKASKLDPVEVLRYE